MINAFSYLTQNHIYLSTLFYMKEIQICEQQRQHKVNPTTKTNQLFQFILVQQKNIFYLKSPSMDNSPTTPSFNKKNALSKKLSKLLKQQQNVLPDKHVEKQLHPGKVQVVSSSQCKLRVVNFFGDVNTQIFCLSASYDDQFVAAGCDNGDVRIYNIYQGKLLFLGNSSRLGGYPNTGIRWKPRSNTQIATCNSDGTIKWYNRENQKVISYHEGECGYLCVDYNQNGDWSIFGNQKYQIDIFDSANKKLSQKYDAGSYQQWLPNHTNRIFCIKGIQKQPSLFFSGGWDSTVRLWDLRVPNQYVRKFNGPSISSQSLDLKGNTLLVGNYTNKNIVQTWDFTSGKLIKNIDLQETDLGGSYCLCASYALKSKYNLYGAGLTYLNKIKIFKDDENVGDIQFQAAPLALNFYQYNKKDFLVAGGVEGTIYVVKVKILQSAP